MVDNGNVSVNRPESREVGWAVQASPEVYARRREHSAAVKKWLSLRNLLILVLLLWNGYFLAAVLYGLSGDGPWGNAVTNIVVTLWIWGDFAILVVASSVWAVRRRRGRGRITGLRG